MKSTDHLFELIKSLTKGEKRQFKLHAAGAAKKSYVVLFDVLEKMKTYDEEKLKKKHRTAPFAKNLAVTKQYLYDQILASLRYNQTLGYFNYKEAGKIAGILQLIMKGLYEQANTLLLKVKKHYYDNQDFANLYPLLRAEHELLHRWYDSKQNERELNVFAEQERVYETLGEMHRVIEAHARMRIVSAKHRQARSDQDRELAQEAITPLLNMNPNQIASFEAAVNYHRTLLEYYLYIGEKDKCLFHAKAEFPLYERQSENIKKKFYPGHIRSFANFMLVNEAFNCYHHHAEYLEKLKPKIFDDPNAFEIWALHTLYYLNAKGDFKEAINHIKNITPRLENKKSDNSKVYVMHFRLQFCRACFGALDFERALHWNLKVMDKNYFQDDVFYFGKIINLIIHFELGNFALLESLLRSAYRQLQKHNRIFKLQETLLWAIRKTLTIPDRSSLGIVLGSLLPELEKLKKDPLESSNFCAFDFESWVRSKVENRPFAEIVTEKFGQTSQIVWNET